MDVILIVILIAAAIGLITGIVKGFTNVKAWGNDLLLTTVCTVAIVNWMSNGLPEGISSFLSNNGISQQSFFYVVSLVLCILFILLFSFISYRAKRFFEKAIHNRKLVSYYMQYEEREETDQEMLEALESKDERKFRRLSKRQFKESSGAIGVLNRVCGGITLAIKGALIAFMLVSIALIALDFAQLDILALNLSSNTWDTLKIYAFDLLAVALIMVCLRSGYKSGLLGGVWTLFMLALVVGAGYVSYNLAFNVAEFQSLSAGLAVKLEGAFSSVTEITSGIGITADLIAKIIITVFLFVLSLIPIILIGIFGPKLLDKARNSVIFSSIDGVLGAIVALAILIAVLTVVGAVMYTLNDFEFMSKFNDYISSSQIANAFYSNNILNNTQFILSIPLRNWLLP